MKRQFVCILALFLAPFFVYGCGSQKPTSTVTQDSQLYFVGGGIASLSGAVFAIRDGHLPGKNIHIFETRNIMGGALDGAGSADKFYVNRGARKYNLEVYNCTWDLMSTIPTLTDPNKTLKEEFLEFNKTHKKDVHVRLIDKNRNTDTVTTMGLSFGDISRILWLNVVPESWVENRTIDSYFSPAFFKSNFWYVYASMFGFEPYSALLECKRYLRRFSHASPLMVSGKAEVVHPMNQYTSFILPVQQWLIKQGVDFKPGCKVTDLDFNPDKKRITVNKLHYVQDGEAKEITIRSNDFVFVTNGSMVADSRQGSMTSPAELERGKLDGSWSLWENIAKKKPGLGNPSVFDDHIDQTKWVVFTVTSKDPTFVNAFVKLTGNKPGQSDLVTFKDSSWMMSIHVPDQPQYPNQPPDVTMWMGYGLFADKVGDYVKKKMVDCTGEEILIEVCHQFGFEKELPQILKSSICIPSLMPYDVAQFMPRKRSDRPLVVPVGSTNLGFIGQFTESEECIFLVESSVRSGQMAVYSLLNVDRKIPPVYTAANNPIVTVRNLRASFK